MAEKVLYTFSTTDLENAILGPLNKNIKIIQNKLKCSFVVTQNDIIGDERYEQELLDIIHVVEMFVNKGQTVKERELLSIISMVKNYSMHDVEAFFNKQIVFVNTYDGRSIVAKTINQKYYFDSLQSSDIVFATGSAGSGKTYLAVAYALNLLKKNKIKKIIITRPVVEAGEKLGFLPGDLKEKIDPYLIPIYDAINDILGNDQAQKLLEKGVIEIAPLAYMRGRTLDNAFVILGVFCGVAKLRYKIAARRKCMPMIVPAWEMIAM